ncbi:CaiB/BaiF CoA-transferase family protein [Streptomyces sp. NBRC 110028]|uniref:CaiB/BaiF CoA transferase family protein n=1 Tax=Streptomyces sp. NBRC 110028 TaxID=1621260 RepID=UPI0006E1204A|nr:CaiB/BaiF CoA-transferase family protein [Streptomyces sp. NBRC 110028]
MTETDVPKTPAIGIEEPPLAGIRVIALEHAVAAPLCSRHLADLGADVIKVESPSGGDLARHYDSVVEGQSAYFVWANRGKRSITLDLTSDEGREAFDGLLGRADVFVHNLGPGAVDRLGFGREKLRKRFPKLINCAISGYGSDGPYRDRKAFDLLIQGEAGLLSVTGEPERPAKVGISVADMCAAVYAVSSILAAVLHRERTGAGTFIDTSMLDCLSEWMMAPAYHQLYADVQLPRAGARHNMMVPYGVYPTGDGEHVNFAVQTAVQWARLCEQVIDRPDLVEDERFATNELRVKNRADLEPVIEEKLAELGTAQVIERLVAAGIPTAAVNDLNGLVHHPQHEARVRWVEADSPGGPVRVLRSPFNLDGLPEPVTAIPGLGEHTETVLAELRQDVGKAY